MGADMAAVVLTAPEQIDPERWAKNLQRYPAMQAYTWDTQQSTRIADSLLRQAGIPTLDLLPSFEKAAAEGAQLHLRHDGHWTEQGHALAAAALTDFLVDNGLVPAPAGTFQPIGLPAPQRSLRQWLALLIVAVLVISLVWSIIKTGPRAWLRNAGARLSTVGELLTFMLHRRQYLVLPLVIVLLLFGALLIIAQASVVGPFIYTLF